MVYAKLFASMYQGTLRGDSDGLLVFTNLLAHCDVCGIVDMHPRAIAEEVGLPVERVELALMRLESEDSESRSPEENGKRIIRLDDHRAWGWQVVNHGKYRAIRSEEDRREQNRLAQQRWRERNKSVSKISRVSPDKPIQKQIQKQKQKENTARKRAPASPVVSVSDLVAEGVQAEHASDWLRTRGKPLTGTAWTAVQREAKKAGLPIAEAVRLAAEAQWRGFKAEWVKPETMVGTNGDAKKTSEYLSALSAHKAERPPAEVMALLNKAVKRC